MIQYDESYFQPEERDGEHLKAMEKRFWASTMESLEQVDKEVILSIMLQVE